MRRYEQERRAGAAVQLLSREQVHAIVPDLFLEDILFGVFGPEDGYAAPREVLDWASGERPPPLASSTSTMR